MTSSFRFRNFHPALASLAVVAVVTLLAGLAQTAGWLQPLELWVHDQFVAWRGRYVAWNNPDALRDPRLVIVGVTAADLEALDYPLTDETLARLL